MTDKPIATGCVRLNDVNARCDANFASLLRRLGNMTLQRHPCCLEEGEVFLFHGTDRQQAQSIILEGFKMAYANPGLYGSALYLCEHAQKADQYADDARRRRSTDLFMFVVRVALGRTEMFENKVDDAEYDTIVAGKNKLFREYVKTNEAQLYPAFLIHYDRVQESSV